MTMKSVFCVCVYLCEREKERGCRESNRQRERVCVSMYMCV